MRNIEITVLWWMFWIIVAGFFVAAADTILGYWDFEDYPRGRAFSEGDGIATWGTEQADSGTHSLGVAGIGQYGEAWSIDYIGAGLSPGDRICLDLYAKVLNPTDGATAKVTIYSKARKALAQGESSKTTGSTNWTKLTACTDWPAGGYATKMTGTLYGQGNAWFDSFTLYQKATP